MLESLPLRWDNFNTKHIISHEISREGVETAYRDQNRVMFSSYKERFICIGAEIKGRIITVILSRSNESYYVITARPASRKERETYDQANR